MIILLSGCNKIPTLTKKIYLKRYTKCDGVRVRTQKGGYLSPKDSVIIIRCYKGMKHYYETRDAYFNRIMNRH